MGVTLQGLDRLEEALASIKQAIALESDYAEAHSNLGTLLQELGIVDEAKASFEQALVLKPEDAEVKFQKAVLLFNRQEFQLGWSLYTSNWDPKREAVGLEVTPGSFTDRAEWCREPPWAGKTLKYMQRRALVMK